MQQNQWPPHQGRFQVSCTFASPSSMPRSWRPDIDMHVQRQEAQQRLHDATFLSNTKDFETTLASSQTHLYYLQSLVAEASLYHRLRNRTHRETREYLSLSLTTSVGDLHPRYIEAIQQDVANIMLDPTAKGDPYRKALELLSEQRLFDRRTPRRSHRRARWL